MVDFVVVSKSWVDVPCGGPSFNSCPVDFIAENKLYLN
jgi:hypothetical protein